MQAAESALMQITADYVERRIYMVRGHKVMLDSDLAALYEVETSNLNKAVRRNPTRFPEDFMFQLNSGEWESLALTFQTGISKGRGGRRYLPLVFTEQGIAMLSSVLSSERAITVNIAIMRAFVSLRRFLESHRELAVKLEDLDRVQREQGSHIEAIWQTINQVLAPPAVEPKRRIGFTE